jgi:hypothetical protein
MNTNSLFETFFYYLDLIDKANDAKTISMLTEKAEIIVNFLTYFLMWGN